MAEAGLSRGFEGMLRPTNPTDDPILITFLEPSTNARKLTILLNDLLREFL